MTKEEKQKLNEKELYKLFDKGDIDAREFDELRKALPSYQQEKMNAMLFRKKKSEIVDLYKKGELSISDTIAYENNLLLNRNRKKHKFYSMDNSNKHCNNIFWCFIYKCQ